MSVLTPILVYGHDSRLLETRCLVLETVGSKIYAAYDRDTLKLLVKCVKPGVLVLCFTLSFEDRDMVRSFIQMTAPATKVLTLRADTQASNEDDGEFSVYKGQAALRARIAKMLTTETLSPQTA